MQTTYLQYELLKSSFFCSVRFAHLWISQRRNCTGCIVTDDERTSIRNGRIYNVNHIEPIRSFVPKDCTLDVCIVAM